MQLNRVHRSKELLEALRVVQTKSNSYISDVRGAGLMVAVEFRSPSYSPYDPALSASAPKNLASRVAKKCVEKGMLILTTSVYEVIRFIPPLNISKEDLATGCAIFAQAVEDVLHEG